MMLCFGLLFFVFGSVIGSFLGCLIYRLETGQLFESESPEEENRSEQGERRKKPEGVLSGGRGILTGRSFCPQCEHTLGWGDLIPLLSFVWLRGRCRYCQKAISWQYPLVELATAIVFVLIFFFVFQGQPQLINSAIAARISYYLLVAALLIVIFVFDLKHYLIPDEIVYSGIIVSLAYHLFEAVRFADLSFFFYPLGVAFLTALFFFLIHWLSRGRAMGFGDVKLAFLMGLFLGFPNILVALLAAFSSGAIIGLGLMLGGKKTLKSELPFAPFLVFGTFLALFWGEIVTSFYLSLFH